MAEQEPGYLPITLRRGETRPIPLTYGPRDPTLPRYNLTGQPVEMRIQPDDAAEIVIAGPNVAVTNGPAGEITIAIPAATVTAFAFNNADYVLMLNARRLLHGPLTIKGIYE